MAMAEMQARIITPISDARRRSISCLLAKSCGPLRARNRAAADTVAIDRRRALRFTAAWCKRPISLGEVAAPEAIIRKKVRYKAEK